MDVGRRGERVGESSLTTLAHHESIRNHRQEGKDNSEPGQMQMLAEHTSPSPSPSPRRFLS